VVSRTAKFAIVAAGLLLLASSGVIALAHGLGPTIGDCMQTMGGMHSGWGQRPNEQWRQPNS
jgi:hypothetical protein